MRVRAELVNDLIKKAQHELTRAQRPAGAAAASGRPEASNDVSDTGGVSAIDPVAAIVRKVHLGAFG